MTIRHRLTFAFCCALLAVPACSLLAPSDQARTAPPDLALRLEQRISVKFHDTPLDHAVSDLARRNNLNVVLDNVSFGIAPVPADRDSLLPSNPCPSPLVTLNLRDAKLRHVLNWLCRLHDLAYTIQDNTLVLSCEDRLPGPDLAKRVYYDSECQRLFDALSGPVISLDFTSATIEDIVDLLGKRTHLNFVVHKDDSYDSRLRLTVRLSNVKLGVALDKICAAAGLRYTVADDAILIATTEAVKAIDRVRTLAPDPEESKRLRDVLKEPVSCNFIATPLADAMGRFRASKKMNIIIDATVARERGDLDITLYLEGKPTLGQCLDRIVGLLGLGYVVRDGAIFVSTRGRLAELDSSPALIVNPREWGALVKVLDQSVSFDFIATPLKDGATSFRDSRKGLVVLDKQASAALGSLDLTLGKMRFVSAVNWVCRILDLAWTVVDGRIYISTREHVLQVIE